MTHGASHLCSASANTPDGALAGNLSTLDADDLPRLVQSLIDRQRIDFAPLVDAGQRLLTWLCDAARIGALRVGSAEGDSAEAEFDTIARFEEYARALFRGARPANEATTEEDILTVASLAVRAIGQDLGLPDLGHVTGAIYDTLDDALGTIAARRGGDRTDATTDTRDGDEVRRPFTWARAIADAFVPKRTKAMAERSRAVGCRPPRVAYLGNDGRARRAFLVIR